MDKNKNKADLIAAGRKKLQQFRQKKDNKGGKSASKSGKTERNEGTSSTKEAATAALQTGKKGKQSTHDADDVASSELHSHGADVLDTAVDQAPEAASAVTTGEKTTDVLVEDSNVGEAELNTDVSREYPVQSSSIQEGDYFVVEEVGNSSNAEVLGVATDSPIPSSVDSHSQTHGLFQERQVTALGAMQNAAGLKYLIHVKGAVETVSGEDKKLPSSESDAPLIVISGTMDEQSEAAMLNPSIEDPEHMSLSADEEKQVETVGRDIDTQGSSVDNSHIYDEVLQSESNDLPTRKDVVQMEPLLERLKEQLYLTTLVKDAAHLELSEQIDIHSELSQHSRQFSDKLSSATTSLDEFHAKNENLAEEVTQYKYQLKEANSMKEGLLEELNGSKAEVEKSSARVNQLLNEFEISQGDISRLSSELIECRNSLASFQTENETLRQSLHLATEEKEQLEVHKTNMILENEELSSELTKCRDLLVSLQSENANMTEHVAQAEGMNSQLGSENELLLSQNDNLVTELGECKNMLLSLQLENENLNASVLEERNKIDHEKDYLLHESEEIATESIKCMVLLEAMQMELFSNKSMLVSATDERTRLEEERMYFFTENEKLSSELVNCKALIDNLHAEFSKAADDLKERTSHIEQLVEENSHLKSNLEIQKDKLRDLEDWQMRSSSIEKLGDQVEGCRLLPEGHDGSLVLEGLEKHIKEGTTAIRKLQKAIEGMHLHSAFVSASSSEVGSSGVSKLIQAFETEGNIEGHVAEDLSSSGSQLTDDPYEVSKQQMQHLEEVLQQLLLDAANAAKVTKAEKKHSKFSNASVAEFRESYDPCNCVETNLELTILLEALRQHVHEANVKGSELVGLYEASQEKSVSLRAENSTITSKLRDFEAKHGVLQSQLDETYQSSGMMFSSLSSQVEALDEVVVSREVMLEEEWNSVVMQIIQMLDKLNSSSTMISSPSTSDIRSCVAASVDAAINVIEDLKGQLESAKKDHELVLNMYNEVKGEFNGLQEQHTKASNILHKIYSDLVRLVRISCGSIEENESNTLEEILLDPRAPGGFDTVIKQVEAFLSERLNLQYNNSRLTSELTDRTNDIDEITNNSVGSDDILKLVDKFDQEFRLERFGSETTEPLPLLESLMHSLVQKYKEANERANSYSEMYASKSVELSDFQGQIDQLSLSLIQHENEIFVLKESLKNAEDSGVAIQSELLGKIAELEQSEQRVSSLREKLSMAVTKGKGLIVQRDNLKHSLAETSADFEKCRQDLLAKESRFSELENKLKAYMEAGERMEALESELSYIRNSATALRESFLLKDSALQRIEEILEDLELPEIFHSGDIIQKVDWLAKYVSGNSLPLADWDQKTSVGGGAYSDAGTVDAEGWKEEARTNLNANDNYRKMYEDLQTRFYGLAEQNEMLEQSLMERNNLVQQWEEILDRIEVPSQLRSMEPEYRIEWLGSALSEAQNYCNSLQEKINNLETSSALVTTDLERSERRTSELEKASQLLRTEKESLSRNLEILTRDYDEMSKKASELVVENGSLQEEVVSLQKKLDQKHGCEERVQYFEAEIRKLQDVVRGVLQDSGLEDTGHGCDGFDYFRGLIMKLLEKHAEVSRNPDAEQVTEDPREPVEQLKVLEDLKGEIIILNTKLDNTITELFTVKEERNGYLEKNHSLVHEVEELKSKMINFQDQISQEEHKSSTLREKLNVAVRKGKSLMQQRDSMKQAVEETNSEIGRLKSAISEYENKAKDLSALQEDLETLRSENIFLRDLISQNDQAVQEKDHTLSLILNSLGHIDVGDETGIVDPVEKLEKIGKHCKDLQSDLATVEQESSKSKRAAELLLAELNEVQERNDVLQEELAKASTDLLALSREKDHFHSEAMQARSNMEQVHKDLSSLSELLGNVLSNDLKTLRDLKVCINSCHEFSDAPSLLAQLSENTGDLISFKSGDKALLPGISSLRGQLHRHLELVQGERSGLAGVIGLIYSELNSQKESCESMRRDIQRLETVEIEKDSELLFARRNFSLLLDACTTTVTEIDNFKTELVGPSFSSNDARINISPKTTEFTEETLLFSSEEGIRAIREQLFSAVKDLMNMQVENSEINLKDLRSTILNLQKEMQEKDIQGERNSMQLVQQIKEAEAIAKKYSQELQLSQDHVEDLHREVQGMEEVRNLLEKRTKDLHDKEASCMEYKGKIQSLTDELAAKVQENEALLQALDEEEIQMEDMRNKIGELERVLQQKDQDLEKLDISRGKALKKLSVTVSKFDELHLLSENLLSEVENLQSQLQDRDQEISFLRQEVTRCTKDALLASQVSNNGSSNEVSELMTWLATMFPIVQAGDSNIGDMKTDEGKAMLKEQIISAVSELEDLRGAVRNGDKLLQLEKAKVEELTIKERSLQSYLQEKESQLAMLRGDVGQSTSMSPEIVELEPMINKRAASVAAPQVRSLRKANSEQVSIAIDVDPNNEKLEEEDDDKAHGFKSLTTSRIVPRFTRPVTDMVDGLWVSCDRALMRQPALRLGVIFYWALLHALLAAYVV